MSGPHAPEMNAKPMGFILLDEADRAAFDTLSLPQKGYFLHWLRSNPHCGYAGWNKALRKAKEQRP